MQHPIMNMFNRMPRLRRVCAGCRNNRQKHSQSESRSSLLTKVAYKNLLPGRAFVNGHWVNAQSGLTFPVYGR